MGLFSLNQLISLEHPSIFLVVSYFVKAIFVTLFLVVYQLNDIFFLLGCISCVVRYVLNQ